MDWTFTITGSGDSHPEATLRRITKEFIESGLEITSASFTLDDEEKDFLEESEQGEIQSP